MDRYHIEKISDNLFRSYDFSKIDLHCINRKFILSPYYRQRWQAADQQKIPVAGRRSPFWRYTVPLAASSQIVFSKEHSLYN
jgi:hypothetical protein